MLDRLRERLGSVFLSLGSLFARAGLSPTAWTFVGLFFALLSAASFARGGRGQIAGGFLILVSGFFDVIDGAVARVTGKVSKRGGFLDSTLDRLGEVAIYFGILLGGYSTGAWVLLAAAFSLLVSYTRAKAESLGTTLSGVGIGERSERIIVLAVFAVVGRVSWGVVLVAILAGFTFVERTYRASSALRTG